MKNQVWALEGIEKSFCGIPVLSGIRIELLPGETHGLLGCNGAGKTTLVRILSGDIQPDQGSVYLDGQPVVFKTPRDAVRAGVAISAQDLTLFPDMTVADNLFIKNRNVRGTAIIRYGVINEKTRTILDRLGVDAQPDRRVGQLSQGEKYLIQFARCYLAEPKLLILDELSASLTKAELNTVHDMVAELKTRGTAVLYITHRMQDIMDVSDRVTILRDGKVVMQSDIHAVTEDALRAQIFGESTSKLYPKLPLTPGREILAASHISNAYLEDVSVTLRQREILGVLGIAGSGRSRLLRALSGVDQIKTGSLSFSGRPVGNRRDRPFPGVAYIPEDRNAQALFDNFNVYKNITIASLSRGVFQWLLKLRAEGISCRNLIDRLGIRVPRIDDSVRFLSGGSKQKVVVARYLHARCAVYLFDEPTQGVDTAGKVEIYNIIGELARRGAGIVLVSSDYAELLGMCDRVITLRDGKITSVFSPADAPRADLLDGGYARNVI